MGHRQEAQSALPGLVAELGQEALRVQGEGPAHGLQHVADAFQLRLRVHGVRQRDGIAAQLRRLPALGGQQDTHAVGLLQHIGIPPHVLQALRHRQAVHRAPVALHQRLIHRQRRRGGRTVRHRPERQLRGVQRVQPERPVFIHRAHHQMLLGQIAGGIHLAADALLRQGAGADRFIHRVQRGLPRQHAHQQRRAGEGVQVARRVLKQSRVGKVESVAAAVQGGIAHSVRVKVQQAQPAAGKGRLIALLPHHGHLPGGHVQQRRAALGVVRRQEKLHRHLSAGCVKGRDVQHPQLLTHGHRGGLSIRHGLPVQHVTAEEVVAASVIGEEAVHVLGLHRADLSQVGGQQLPCVGVPVAQGEAPVGEGLLLHVPHALQRHLLTDGVIGGVHQLYGGTQVLIVLPAHSHRAVPGGADGGQRGGMGAL